MKKVFLVALTLAGIATVGCKKDKDIEEPPSTVDLITSSTWRIDTIGFDQDKDGQIDGALPGGLLDCQRDNTITFSSDSTGLFDEGATRCSTDDEQSTPFNWTLSGSDSLNIEGELPGELGGLVKIISISDSNFTLSKRITSNFPVPFDQNMIVALKK